MMLAMLLSPALATDLVFDFSTGEGLEEAWRKDHNEAVTKEFGPLEGRGKRRVSYVVTLMPSVYDPLELGFETRVSICRSWSKKSKRGRDCLEDLVLVPSVEAGAATMGGKIKASDKFELYISVHYEGVTPGMPQPETVEEEPVEEEPSALENIARDIVDGLEENMADSEETED